MVAVFAPDGQQLNEIDRPNGAHGLETISLLATVSGPHRLVIRALEQTAPRGQYTVRLAQLRAPLPEDEPRLAAERALSAGERARTGSTADALQKAVTYFKQALALWQTLHEPDEEATTHYGLGWTFDALGEYEAAIEHYNQALALRQAIADQAGAAATQMGAAWAYLHTNELDQAHWRFNQALQFYQTADYQPGQAIALFGLGWMHAYAARDQQALDTFLRSLPLRRAVNDRRGEANTLTAIGRLYNRLGQPAAALEHLQQALTLLRGLNKRREEADTIAHLAWVYLAQNNNERAQSLFTEALQLRRAAGDRAGEATVRVGLARLARRADNLTEACAQAEAALQIIESLRSKGANQQLRAAYLAQVQDYYELYIELLMQRHARQPEDGHAATALHVSERARARSLLDLLHEARVDLRRDVDAALLARERELQQKINDTSAQQLRLSGEHSPSTKAAALAAELQTLLSQLQETQTRIRRAHPRYADLMQSQPLTAAQMQQELLDAETLLLEYDLGEEHSYLWAVTTDGLMSFELPPRAAIEALARQFHSLLTARNHNPAGETTAQRQRRIAQADTQLPTAAAALSRVLLDPVAALLTRPRLLIVADGALRSLPFAALPAPEERRGDAGTRRYGEQHRIAYQPLMLTHEVTNAPSASTLAALRRETAQRPPAPKAVALLADPVFDEKDQRLAQMNPAWRGADFARNPAPKPALPSDLLRAAEDLGNSALRFPRLGYTRWEADEIARLAPPGSVLKALDFKASRATALDPALGQYRIVHFAAHGFINNVHPELSGLVLSLVDKRGRWQDGFLRAHEIYQLKLPVELIVLSACRTGLGKEIQGEGLINLTRGFMYAGAPRVAVSLWAIEDKPAAELMVKFYRQMLGPRRLAPAAALRAAQAEMWREGRYAQPYYWAAFVLQGDWR